MAPSTTTEARLSTLQLRERQREQRHNTRLMRLPINRRYWVGLKDHGTDCFFAEPTDGLTITELLAEIAQWAPDLEARGESIAIGLDTWTPRALLEEEIG